VSYPSLSSREVRFARLGDFVREQPPLLPEQKRAPSHAKERQNQQDGKQGSIGFHNNPPHPAATPAQIRHQK
jgi:hypothetical protein